MRTTTKRGFSIIEVLMAGALTAVLLSAVVTSLNVFSGSVRANESAMRGRQSADRAMALIVNQVRRAKELNLDEEIEIGSGKYTGLATLDEGVFNPDTGEYNTEGAVWTIFTFESGTLYVEKTVGSDVVKAPVLRNIRSLVFRGAKSGTPARYRDVTVEITIDTDDAFSKRATNAFSLTGTTAVRALTF